MFFNIELFFSKKNLALKEEIITLSAKSKSTEELQEIIKRDFVQLANETIKNEQEDLRKQILMLFNSNNRR